MYHFIISPDIIFDKFVDIFPNHQHIVIQGNTPRVKKRGQKIAGIDGMVDFLQKRNYSIYKIFEWNGYQKPVVIGHRVN
jgi:hypothetical protein